MERSLAERVKPPAVAGLFYPDDAALLHRDVSHYLAEAGEPVGDCPHALIVPHAGYRYSGPIAASAYRLLQAHVDRIDRILLMGPAHRVGFHGIALHSAESFHTPLGDVPLDRALLEQLQSLPFVHPLDATFAQEHCLEVQLPFLQTIFSRFTLAPLVIGQSDYAQVAQVLSLVADDPATLILISSDLSHYHSYVEAQEMDRHTSKQILALNAAGLGHEDACGRLGIGGLLEVAQRKGWRPELLDLRNSGDTAGTRDQVVGYGAYAFF